MARVRPHRRCEAVIDRTEQCGADVDVGGNGHPPAAGLEVGAHPDVHDPCRLDARRLEWRDEGSRAGRPRRGAERLTLPMSTSRGFESGSGPMKDWVVRGAIL